MTDLQVKKNKLVKNLQELGSVLVAFSGGVDSSLLISPGSQDAGQQMPGGDSQFYQLCGT
jgi:PP-loop superfamily ATP-utilizing enzyme